MWDFFLDKIRERAEERRSRRVTLSDARDRARRGASFLDETAPGWAQDIDAWSLDLAGDGACVLGHLHGSFALGLGRSGLFSVSSAPRASFSPVELGFHCIPDVGDALQAADYAYLNRAWHDEIVQRVGDARFGAEPSLLQISLKRGQATGGEAVSNSLP